MMQSIETEFTKAFNVRYPIIGAPMFLVSNEEMVIATSRAGGLGTFPALNFRPIERYAEALRKIKAEAGGPVGVNIIVQKQNKFQEKHLDLALEHGVDLIITSLGNPRDVIRRAHQTNTKVYCDVVNLDYAKKCADLGADGLIAVASGAGGHAGELSAFALIPYLKAHINLPVVAAGSIVDGKGMAAAFALGASAVYMGTRLIATTESPANQEYKEAIVHSGCEKIVNTDRVDGFPGNFIKTKSLEKIGLEMNFIEAVLSQSKRFRRGLALTRAARSLLAGDKSKVSYKNVFSAGHGVGLIHDVVPIAEVFRRTISEYYEIRQRLP
jgi:nitronate monooxygenase